MQFTILDLMHELHGSPLSHLTFLVRHWMHDRAGRFRRLTGATWELPATAWLDEVAWSAPVADVSIGSGLDGSTRSTSDAGERRSTVDMVVQGGEEEMHETLRAGLILIFLDVDNLRNRESINT